jgi:hypothetical protein
LPQPLFEAVGLFLNVMKTRWLIFSLLICVLTILLLKTFVFNRQEKISQPDSNSPVKSAPQLQPRRSGTLNAKLSPAKPEFQVLADNILELINSNNPADINRVYNVLVPNLVKMDPRAAAEFSQSPAAEKWRADLMMVVAQSWARLNPDDAQDWVSNLPNPPDDPTERDTMVSYVTFAVADMDPGRAVQVLEQCPMNKDRFEIMVENLAQQWTDQNSIQPLVDLIAKMPPSADRDGYFARIANAMARSDVMQASEIVSDDISPGPTQIDAAIGVVKQLAWNDKNLALEWVNSFPPGEVHDRALKEWTETVAKREGKN